MARLLFLGRLEDAAGTAMLDIPLNGATPLADLVARLPGDLAMVLSGPRVKLALNDGLVAPDGLVITDADELAFLPPVSGG